MKPVKQTGDETGGPEQPISKPLDKAPDDYIASESVPPDDFHEVAFEGSFENQGSFAKKFS
jgi:hypothetical protein